MVEAVHQVASLCLAMREADIFRTVMSLTRTIRCVAVIALFCCSWQADGQAGSSADQSSGAYSLRLPVNEVVVTFHATDAQGLPINNLTLGEIKLYDKANRTAQNRSIRFFD